jgi:DNA invertase Pin-like site-specific DNA recombinase
MRLVEIRRVSTEEQAKDDRSGLDRQAAENRRTAERVGAALVEPPIVITDVCRENFIDTPEWTTIRSLIADPNVHIVVDMQDRIVGALEGLPILIECKRTKTLIYHSQGVTDPTTFAGQVLATFTALAAGNELHTIRHRAQGGKEAKRRDGIFASADISLRQEAQSRSRGCAHSRNGARPAHRRSSGRRRSAAPRFEWSHNRRPV